MSTVLDRFDVVEALFAAGLDEDALRDDYSGRAMYGETCMGIVTGNVGQVLEFAVACAARAGSMDPQEWIGRACEDNMGRSMITYWPGVTVTGEDGS